MPQQLLTIPGKITPGLTKEIVNQPMNQYNDLRNAMLVHPEVLDATAIHFAEQQGMISSLLAHFGNYYSPSSAMAKGNQYYAMMQKQFKFIGNHEFAWRGAAPRGFVYQFTRDAEGVLDANGLLGTGGRDFFVYIDRKLVDQDDVFRLGDGETQIMAIRAPIGTDRLVDGRSEMKCRCRLMIENPNQGLDPILVSKNMECERVYNIKPEASEHGSKIRVPFGDWFKNYMTTMRWEWNVTGHVAHSKTDTKWVVYTGNDGKIFPYWIPVLDYEMMMTAQESCENFLWNGKKAINPDGSFLRDGRGREYISGDGAYTQCNKKLRFPYNNLTVDFVESAMETFKMDSINIVDRPRYVIKGGVKFRVQFDKMLRQIFNADPEVFYFYENGVQKVKSNFTVLETPLGEFYLESADYLDSKYHPSFRDEFGNRYQSYRGFIVNISQFTGGRKMMQLVSRAGRQHVTGEIVGMSNVGNRSSSTLTTTADVQGKHLLKELGIAVMNPNCLGEFYKPIPRGG